MGCMPQTCGDILISLSIPSISIRMKGTAQVRREGRITLPKSVRQELNLDYGDFVVIDVRPVEKVNDG